MSDPQASASPGFSLQGRVVEAGRPVEWLKGGWATFLQAPGVWLAATLVALLILTVLAMVPVLGHLAANFAGILFAAGLLLGCRELAAGGELRVDHLFAGFKQQTNGLMLLGTFYLAGLLGIGAVTFVIGGGAAMSGAMMGHMAGAGIAFGGFLLAVLVALALLVPLTMAVWFAPALVAFRGVAPLAAMKASLGACLRNLLPMLVYGVILFVLGFVAAIPFGLGLLVLLPVVVGAQYASYVEIFE